MAAACTLEQPRVTGTERALSNTADKNDFGFGWRGWIPPSLVPSPGCMSEMGGPRSKLAQFQIGGFPAADGRGEITKMRGATPREEVIAKAM